MRLTKIVLKFNTATKKEYIIREFSDNTNEDELVWHRDKTSRRVHVLRGRVGNYRWMTLTRRNDGGT